MKFILHTLSIIGLGLSLTVNAQSSKNKTKLQPVDKTPSEVKSEYINNQDYLSESSLKDYNSYYGDSLNGFDEAAVKADLLNKHVYGQEYIGYIKIVKRNFINKKYSIGQYAPSQQQVQTPVPPTPGKNIGGGSFVNVAPCVNEGFESTTAGAYTGASNSLAVRLLQETALLRLHSILEARNSGSDKLQLQVSRELEIWVHLH
jgi:hypothetical protein